MPVNKSTMVIIDNEGEVLVYDMTNVEIKTIFSPGKKSLYIDSLPEPVYATRELNAND